MGGGMPLRSGRSRSGFLFAALLLSPLQEARATTVTSSSAATTPVQSRIAAAVDEYRRKLQEYLAARRKYEGEARAYWNSIADKRRIRNAKRRNNQEILIDDYVLTQPPVYSGPPKPVDPSAPPEEAPPRYVPVVTDFLESAAREFRFVPEQPRSESQYKRAYAVTASAAGLTRDQAVRIGRRRQIRRAGRIGAADPRCPRGLDCARLQSAADHQQRRADGRERQQ